MFTKGVIIGKFYPFHKGHEYLIKTSLGLCDHLTVLVCTLSVESIDGKIRYQWVKDRFPEATVIHVTDENPQYPEEHPDFWNIWVNTIQKAVPEKLDYIFSSENYGYELANYLNITHIPIDIDRKVVPISGTAIRNSIYQYRNYLPKTVRKYFTKKVVIYGSESTGKTTAARLLSEHFNTSMAPEYAREYLKDKGLDLEPSDFLKIAEGQILEEEKALEESDGVVFYDTDLFTTKIYSQHYMGSCDPIIIQKAESRKYDLYLLMDIDIPWIDDPLRDIPDEREYMKKLFIQELETRKIPYILISGNYTERIRKAIYTVEKLLL